MPNPLDELMKKLSLLIISTLLVSTTLGGCKQDLPKEVNDEAVFGTVQDLKTVPSEHQLIYQLGEDPYKKNWGSTTAYYVRVNDVMYPVLWDDAELYKKLKVGDKVNLHPSEYISCVGENDLKPNCHRMMKVYKSDRRIPPLDPR